MPTHALFSWISCIFPLIFQSFYQYATCKCQRGFTSGGAPPNCLEFPHSVALGSNAGAGVFGDGSSAGRLRQGVDSEWTISPTNGPLGVITIVLTLFPPKNGSNYQITLFPSGSISQSPLLFTASNELAQSDFLTRSFATRTISIISSTVLLHLVSNSDAGPIFNATYVTSSSCPGDLIADRKTSVCMPRSDYNVAILGAGTQKWFLVLTGALLVYTLLNSLLIVRFWKHQVMHAASPLIMLVFTLGVLLVLSASLIYTRTMTTELCEAHVR